MADDEQNISEVSDEQTQSAPVGDELSALKAENETLKSQALRAMADLQNYRRRVEEEKKTMFDFAATSMILDILPIIDNFQRSLEHLPENLKNEEWVKGIEHILAQCLDLLEKRGVQVMQIKTGDPVDPNLHQAVMNEAGPEGTILEVFEKGYTLNGKVIRTAKVKVGKVN